eukprot:g3415.t1
MSSNSNILLERQSIRDDFEVAVVRPPRVVLTELGTVFPALLGSSAPNVDAAKRAIVCIPTMQRSSVDICKLGPEVEKEKDRLLISFMSFSKTLRKLLLEAEPTCWADYIDPCSAFPVNEAQSASGYSEVDGLQVLLRFRTNQAGGCKIVEHPEWGTSLYPATFFTTATFENIKAAIEKISKDPNL